MHLAPLIRRHGADLDQLARSAAAEATRADLDQVAHAAVADHCDLRRAEQLHIGPTFAQSGRLGNADADLIADGCLIELKSSATASPIGRLELWQVLGYLLADTDDEFGIHRCEIAALRRRRACAWRARSSSTRWRASPPSQWRTGARSSPGCSLDRARSGDCAHCRDRCIVTVGGQGQVLRQLAAGAKG